MNSPDKEREKRRAPRIKRQVSLKIKHDDYDLVGQTLNISCIGAYCTVDKYIPPFSLLSIILLLPLRIKKRKSVYNVRCQGIVVRTEENPLNTKEYNIAIYFKRLKQSDRARLSRYVRQYL